MPQKSGYLSDYWASQDGLKYDAYRSALLDVLLQGATPLTVGVFGTWGSGKTSLLRMMKNEIDKNKLAKQRAIWFTAWKYEHQDALWRAFILQVIGGLLPRKPDGARYQADELTDQSQKEGVQYLERLERALYETVSWQEKGDWTLDLGEVKKAAIHLPIWLAFKLAGLGDAAKDLGMDPNFAQTLEREIRDHHFYQLQSMEQFAEQFEKAVRLILGDEGRLVIFVDDLDRCLPEKAIEILEAIKLFLDVPGTVFVLGMDREIVRRGVETHYRSILNISPGEKGGEEMPIDGDLYLQKIIQIPFNLPPLDVDNRKAFIVFQVDNLPEDYRLDPVTREVMARGCFPNPRQVKRALNIFNLLRQVAKKQEEQGNIPPASISWPLLAKAVLIQSQWPGLYQKWRQYPTLIQTLEEEYTRQPFSDEEALRGISAKPTKQKGESNPSGMEESLPVSPPPSQVGVLDEYLSNRSRYALLIELLRYPDPKDKDASQARFAGLTKAQMRLYIGLTASAESAPESGLETVPLSSLRWDFLASGDEVKINEALADIDEKEPDPTGPLHQSSRQMLVSLLQNQELPTRMRVSSGDALARLGDPRFDPDFYFLPREDLCGFVHIPAGPFFMGSDKKKDPQAADNEQPQHSVTLPDYFIQRYPVTTAQHRIFMEQSGLQTSDKNSLNGPANHPVNWLSWYHAMAYADWLMEKLMKNPRTPGELRDRLARGWRVSLPSEAEWEKAARGSDGRIYPWGDAFDPDKANTEETKLGSTSAVGCFSAGRSPYGIQDLSGNVWEWTRSLWGKDGNKPDFGYPFDPQDNRREDLKAGRVVLRVVRGGSFGTDRRRARCAFRTRDDPDHWLSGVGFRLVLSPFTS